MLVGIISDSHDNLTALRRALKIFTERDVGMVLHAGDLVAPFTYRIMSQLTVPYHIVFGNNDGERLGLKNAYKDHIHVPPYRLQIDGKRILLLHEPNNLEAVAASGHFDLIVYGHTHEIDLRREPTQIINPGECGGWVTGEATAALWNSETGEVEILSL